MPDAGTGGEVREGVGASAPVLIENAVDSGDGIRAAEVCAWGLYGKSPAMSGEADTALDAACTIEHRGTDTRQQAALRREYKCHVYLGIGGKDAYAANAKRFAIYITTMNTFPANGK